MRQYCLSSRVARLSQTCRAPQGSDLDVDQKMPPGFQKTERGGSFTPHRRVLGRERPQNNLLPVYRFYWQLVRCPWEKQRIQRSREVKTVDQESLLLGDEQRLRAAGRMITLKDQSRIRDRLERRIVINRRVGGNWRARAYFFFHFGAIFVLGTLQKRVWRRSLCFFRPLGERLLVHCLQ